MEYSLVNNNRESFWARQFIGIKGGSELFETPPLMVSLFVRSNDGITSKHITNSKYLVRIVSTGTKKSQFITPSRLKKLSLVSTNVYCINTKWYLVNQTKRRLRVSKSILEIDLRWVKARQPPSGFFTVVTFSSMSSIVTKQGRLRESTIYVLHWCMTFFRFAYFAKSVKEINFYYVTNHSLRRQDKNEFDIYNTRYNSVTRMHYDHEDTTQYIIRVIRK